MKSTIIEKAKRIIKYRHFDAENTALANKTKAFEDETFKSIYKLYVDKMIENARENLADDENLKQLKSKLQTRLKELNIGSIEPQYTCPLCNDTALNDEGKYCHCMIDEINKILIE